jgi:ectoine hydroxylase-related dioxygenase (phytanoyl-CoA dioxygenase family)
MAGLSGLFSHRARSAARAARRWAGERRAGTAPPPRRVALDAEQVRHFQEQGYLVLPGFLDAAAVAGVNAAVERAWSDRSIYNPLTISAFTNSASYTETYLRNVDRSARQHNYKINHLYLYDPFVRELLLGDAVQEVAAQLLEGTPLLFNSLNMEWGSEQRFHFDTFYMPPPVPGRLVVFWFALEDVRPGAGALQYYPRSHLVPPYRFSHGAIWALPDEMDAFDRYVDAEIRERGLEPVSFLPRQGDVFVWHAQLYHGGSRIEDRRLTRRSLVAHFWRVEDLPPEQVWELAPGRFAMDPRSMCVATSFRPGDDAALGAR